MRLRHAVLLVGAIALSNAALAADIDTRVIRQASRNVPQESLPPDETVRQPTVVGNPLLAGRSLNLVMPGFAGVPFPTSDALSKSPTADTPVL